MQPSHVPNRLGQTGIIWIPILHDCPHIPNRLGQAGIIWIPILPDYPHVPNHLKDGKKSFRLA